MVLIPAARGGPSRSDPGAAVRPARAAALLAAPPTLTGPEIWLCASKGSATMPDGVKVPIWGFSADGNGAGPDGCEPAALPGPTLEVTQGEHVTVHLSNVDVPEGVSITIPGLSSAPDVEGVTAGHSTVYTFDADAPGTYLYGSVAGDQRGVLLGLYGALLVRPSASGQAYGTQSSAYDVESLLVLSEIDADLADDPDGFDLDRYAPDYWLINGTGYPDTGEIEATAGERVLLRYVNAGSLHHTMTLLGAHQEVIARDAYPVSFPYDVVAETIPAGATLDTMVTIPSTAQAGDRLALYSRQLHLTNDGSFPGGMLTFIRVTTPGTNQAPDVDAGQDLVVAFPGPVSLDGEVTDDGLPDPPGVVTVSWTNETPGVGSVTFGDAHAIDTTASFSAPGTYVLRLTADDGALSAWDEVRVEVNDLIFADGFESGDFSRWSARIDTQWDLSVSGAAALAGSFGMAALIDDTTAMFVRDDSPVNEARYHARFRFDPNSITMASGNRHRIFVASNGSVGLVRIDIRWNGTGYQLLASVRSDAGTYARTAWSPITDAPHRIEIAWRAATAPQVNDGSLSLYVDGALVQTLGGIDNDTHRVQQVRLGPSQGIDAGTHGTEFFDDFVSRRASLIGP
jgi:FtsP/CotA-like multicopper oxidase with cupredoxin domain